MSELPRGEDAFGLKKVKALDVEKQIINALYVKLDDRLIKPRLPLSCDQNKIMKNHFISDEQSERNALQRK